MLFQKLWSRRQAKDKEGEDFCNLCLYDIVMILLNMTGMNSVNTYRFFFILYTFWETHLELEAVHKKDDQTVG